MASCIILLKSNIVHIKHRPYHKEQLQKMGYHCVIGVSPLNVKVALSSFWKKYEPMMPPLYKPQQIAARNGCIGFCKTTCGFFFWLLIYPPIWKRALSERMIFFGEIDIIVRFVVGQINPNACSSVNWLITFSADNILNFVTQ